ncbi:DUF2490 domain-containing protein [Empedobacter sedimenti]|uniref:DUF2490 domain-containing protein n=1 Tax=Empedobacter sedimenti TaxID=3042610 RepID=UPI0024A63F98|nr:DUF2490 domain-containing protein [Empedobacter sedimenti]
MKKILASFIILTSIVLQAQESDFRIWNSLNINQKINQDWSFQSDIQYRTYEDLDQLNQLLIRAGIGYNLTENNNTVLAGYAYIQNRTPSVDDNYAHNHEHRLYQQFTTKHTINRFNFAHRFRTEERFLENDTQFRFRYQLTATVPLNNPKLIKNTWYLKAYDELFLQAVKDKTFDRNRLGLSLGYVISPTFSLEAGYMLQSQKKSHTDQLMIGLTINNPI